MERLCGLDHGVGRTGDQVMGLQQPVNRCFGHEVALLVGKAYRQLSGAEFGLLQRHFDDLMLDIVSDTVPHPARRGWAVGQVPSGALGDRFGNKFPLVVGALAMPVGVSLMALGGHLVIYAVGSPAYDREDIWTAIQLKSRKAIENHKDEIRRDPHLSSEGRTVIAFIDDVFDRAWLSDKIDRYLRLELGISARHVVDVLQFLSDNGILVKRDFVTLSATSDQVRSASDKVLAEFKPADGINLLTIDKATPTNIIADAQEVQSKSGIVPVPKDSLTHPNNVTVCIMDKDQVVACTSVVDAGSARYGRKGWYTVMGTAVHPDYRGQLLGRVSSSH